MPEMVNLTPILEQIFSVSSIKSPEDLKLLIQALREAEKSGVNLFDSKALAEVMERFSALKGDVDKTA